MDLFQAAEHRAAAARLRDRGMSMAADAQESKVIGWGELAYMAILKVARENETVHVDQVLEVLQERPAHPNAWGSVWMRAIKDGVIERTGRVKPSIDPLKHKHQYAIYSSKIFMARSA